MAELKFPPTQNGLQKTLDAQLNVGVTSQMTLNNTTGVQNKPGVVVIDRIDTSGAEKSSAVREYISYTGVSGNNLTGLTRGLGGSTDQDHAVGAIVEFIPDVTVFQAINDVITTEHGTDGTHDSTKVAMLAGSQTFTGDKVFSGAVTISGAITSKKAVQTWVTATDGATVTFDLSQGNLHQVTLGGNRTLAVTNVSVGQCFIIHLIQGAGGSKTVTWWSGISWAGGSAPTLTTTEGKGDSFGFICKAAGSYLGYVVGQNL